MELNLTIRNTVTAINAVVTYHYNLSSTRRRRKHAVHARWNTHGLHGTLKVKSFTDFKEKRYKRGTTLYIAFGDTYIPVTVQSWKTNKTLDLLTFQEFQHINQVEQYRGAELCIIKDDQQPLPEDEFYVGDLIGMSVYSSQKLGVVEDVRDVPQGEILVIKTPEKNILIPFRKEFIQAVDMEQRTITIIEWEGLLWE